MFMLLFYLLISAYLIVRGGKEAGFWTTSSMLQGLLMLGSGFALFLEYVL